MTKALTLTPEMEKDIAKEIEKIPAPQLNYIPVQAPVVVTDYYSTSDQTIPYQQLEAFQRDKEKQIKKNRKQWVDALRVYGDKQYFGGWWGYDELGKETFCAQGLVLMLLGIDRSCLAPDTQALHRKGCEWLGIGPSAWTQIASDNDNQLTFAMIADRAEDGRYWQL